MTWPAIHIDYQGQWVYLGVRLAATNSVMYILEDWLGVILVYSRVRLLYDDDLAAIHSILFGLPRNV